MDIVIRMKPRSGVPGGFVRCEEYASFHLAGKDWIKAEREDGDFTLIDASEIACIEHGEDLSFPVGPSVASIDDGEEPRWTKCLEFKDAVSLTSPVVIGTRITAKEIFKMLVNGWTPPQIVEIHDDVSLDDIRAVYRYYVESEDSGDDVGF